MSLLEASQAGEIVSHLEEGQPFFFFDQAFNWLDEAHLH